ncbi:unnamed protein product [Scytosiphon promiscuus]
MATWKRFTGAVDTSAQSFLKNKKFSREKKTFSLDWHLWNFALVATPSLLLAFHLHGVEDRMRKEAAIREEIQERTGVSSRGFLIPKREVREEVLGMLSAGNQREAAEDDKVDRRKGRGSGDGEGGDISTDFKAIHERLAAIESMLGAQSDPGPRKTDGGVSGGPGPGKKSAVGHTSSSRGGVQEADATVEESGAGAMSGTAVEKAKAAASAVGSWVLESGERQGKILLRKGRDWLDARNREGEATRSGYYGDNADDMERSVPEEQGAEEPRHEDRPSEKAPNDVRDSTAVGVGEAFLSTKRSSKRSTEPAWRRGKVEEDDKQS